MYIIALVPPAESATQDVNYWNCNTLVAYFLNIPPMDEEIITINSSQAIFFAVALCRFELYLSKHLKCKTDIPW